MHAAAGLLIAAAAGYLVVERADKHKGSLRRIGYMVGGLIIVSSILGLACAISCKAGAWGYGDMGMKKSGYCPMMPKGM